MSSHELFLFSYFWRRLLRLASKHVCYCMEYGPLGTRVSFVCFPLSYVWVKAGAWISHTTDRIGDQQNSFEASHCISSTREIFVDRDFDDLCSLCDRNQVTLLGVITSLVSRTLRFFMLLASYKR